MKIDFLKKPFWIIILLSLWQIIYVLEVFHRKAFPSVFAVFNTLYEWVLNGNIFAVLLYTLKILIFCLSLGLIIAMALSALAVFSKVFDSFLDTCISIAHPLPAIVLLPLLIPAFGVGTQIVIIIILHSVVWPLVINISTGFKTVNKTHLQVGENIGLSKIDTAIHIYLPSSAPYIISGLKVSWARAWRALITAEMIFGVTGSIGGLGWLIHKQRVFMDTEGLYASLLVIIIVGMLIESTLFTQLEKSTVKKWGVIK